MFPCGIMTKFSQINSHKNHPSVCKKHKIMTMQCLFKEKNTNIFRIFTACFHKFLWLLINLKAVFTVSITISSNARLTFGKIFSLTLGRDVPSGRADNDRIRRRPEAAAHRRRRNAGLLRSPRGSQSGAANRGCGTKHLMKIRVRIWHT